MTDTVRPSVVISAAEHGALLRDRARLNWLADRSQHIGNVQLPRQCVLDNPHDLRAAIDAAMALDSRGVAA